MATSTYVSAVADSRTRSRTYIPKKNDHNSPLKMIREEGATGIVESIAFSSTTISTF